VAGVQAAAVHRAAFEEMRKRMGLADGRKIVVKRMENAGMNTKFE
jgi:hypothetical protein